MKAFVASKLDDYTKGKISRRHLLESLTIATAATAATGGAQAAPAPNRALKAALVNHISYQCPDFHRAADWYSRVFNMEQVTYASEPTQIGMPFGRRNQKPLGVTADDVPTSYIVVRTRNPAGTAADVSASARPRSRATIEHVGYTVADFDRETIFGAGVGHHSPIGGYLEMEDLVFVLNVNRDFQPWLIERSRLFSAMDTLDGQRKRGLLLIE